MEPTTEGKLTLRKKVGAEAWKRGEGNAVRRCVAVAAVVQQRCSGKEEKHQGIKKICSPQWLADREQDNLSAERRAQVKLLASI